MLLAAKEEIKFNDNDLDLFAELARSDFSFFPQLISGNKNPKHIDYIAHKIQNAIEAPIADKYKLLVISVPPRYGKTQLISVHLPAWIAGKYPKKRMIMSSYGAELAETNSNAAKNIFEYWGPLLWNVKPGEIFKRSAWNTEEVGGVIASGVGGPTTGFGADCIDGETLIMTVSGEKKIKNLQNGDMVLSLGEGLCYNKVLAKKESKTNEIYEITIGKNIIRTTGRHRVFVFDKGYIKAKNLQIGDKTITIQQNMSKVWGCEGGQGVVLPELLFRNEEIGSKGNMRLLWNRILSKGIRNTKSKKKWAQRYLLLGRLFKKTSRDKKPQEMRSLWESSTKKNNEVLFKKMQASEEDFIYKKMSKLWKRFSSYFSFNVSLFKRMCRHNAFFKNDRKRKFSLQKRIMQVKAFYRNTTNYFQQRQQYVYCLQNDKGFISTPYKRRYQRRQTGELDNTLQSLPCNSPQIKTEPISSIKKAGVKKHKMYDIQIERTGNFFANQILVHNCYIIDDYIKDHEEASSQLKRDKIWDWFQSVVATRLHPGALLIVFATRWDDDDMVGRLEKQYKEEKEEFPFDMEIINLPAIARENDPIGRIPGEALWPERFNKAKLLNIKKILGPYWWSALYEGDPTPRGGTLFKSQHFRYWAIDTRTGDYLCYRQNETEPLRIRKTELIRHVYVDPAIEIKKKNDPTGMLAWGYSKKHRVWLLLDRLNDRIEHTQVLSAIKNFALKNSCIMAGIENEKLGKVLVKQSAGNDQIGGVKIPFKEIPTKGLDKYARAVPMATYTENERVFFPRNAPWLAIYEGILAKFPNVANDEDIDCTAMAQHMENKMSVTEALRGRG